MRWPWWAWRFVSVPGLALLLGASLSQAQSQNDDPAFIALIEEGGQLEDRRQHAAAADRYQSAAHNAARRGDRANEAWALARRCRALWGGGADRQARQAGEEALSLARSARSLKAEAEAEKALGILDSAEGLYASSERRSHRAAALAAQAGETEIEISALNNLSASALEQGQVTNAVALGLRALKASERFPATSVRMRFAVPYNLAKALEAEGDDESARYWLDRAARSAKETESGGGLHHVLMESAALLLRAGDLDGAARYYERAVAWNELIPSLAVDVALARSGLAATTEARGDFQGALDGYRQALTELQKPATRVLSVETRIAVGRCLGALGRFAEANQELNLAENLATQMGLRIAIELAQLERARLRAREGRPDARRLFEQSAGRLNKMGLASHAALAYAGAARIAEKAGAPDQAIALALLARGEIEHIQTSLPAELQWRFLETTHEVYATVYRLRMARVRDGVEGEAPGLALEEIERERSRDIARAASASRVSATPKTDTKDLEQRLARIQRELFSEIPPENRTALLREQADTERDLALRSQGSLQRRWTSRGGTPQSQQAALASDEVLLTYALDEPAAVFVVTRSTLRAFRLPKATSLRHQAVLFETLHSQGDAAQAKAAGRSLAQALLAPVLSSLPSEARSLLIATTGDLAALPFGVLPHPADGRMLLDHYQVSYAPSLQFIAALRAAPLPTSEGVLVFLAPPADGASAQAARGQPLGPLPWALREGREVAAYFRVRHLLEGSRATPQVMASEGARYGAIHFATHAVNDPLAPMNSALVLAPEDSSRTGWMTARQVYGLSLDAALVTLSACRTSSGPRAQAAAAPSLARAFLYAGSRAVVAGLWDADDAGTHDLMRLFYAELAKGQTVGAALNAAQRSMASSRNASLWAGFEVIGDPKARVRGMTPPWLRWAHWAAVLASIGLVSILAAAVRWMKR